MRKTHKHESESGQSLVELAISLVVLLTLLSGLVDLGRAFFTYTTLHDAAQEGAAYAAVALGTGDFDAGNVQAYCSAVEARARAVSDAPIDLGVSDVSVDILVNGVECNAVAASEICLGGVVTVDVSYTNFSITMPFIGTILGTQQIPLSAVSMDTVLTPTCGSAY